MSGRAESTKIIIGINFMSALPPRITIVIPTYNERRTLRELVERIATLRLPNYSILIVDDSSPDETGALAEELARTYPIRVLHRPQKDGLGRAYACAFSELLRLPQNERPEYVIQMDADLSHDPADIPRLLEKIKECDLVVGSRYVLGGRVERWGMVRRLVSRFGNLYARTLLALPYQDLTSGYKCFRFEVLKALNLVAVSSVGYNFQIETTYLLHRKGFRIREIPIIFTERKMGTSKFNLRIILESFYRVFLTMLKDWSV